MNANDLFYRFSVVIAFAVQAGVPKSMTPKKPREPTAGTPFRARMSSTSFSVSMKPEVAGSRVLLPPSLEALNPLNPKD